MEFMSAQIDQLATALAKAQGEMEGAKKDSTNPFFKSKYADLASVWEACRMPLSNNGLAVVQTLSAEDHLITTLMHTSGQWMRSEIKLIIEKNDCQSVGKSITYFRRFALAALIGVYQEDDDGEGAKDRSYPPKTQPKAVNEKSDAFAPKEAPITINNAEFFNLMDQIGDDPGYKMDLCKHFGIKALADLPFEAYDGVLKAVKKRNENKKQVANV